MFCDKLCNSVLSSFKLSGNFPVIYKQGLIFIHNYKTNFKLYFSLTLREQALNFLERLPLNIKKVLLKISFFRKSSFP